MWKSTRMFVGGIFLIGIGVWIIFTQIYVGDNFSQIYTLLNKS